MTWNLVNTILAVLALAVGGAAAYYAYNQVALIRAEQQRQQKRERENIEWATRANQAIRKLISLVPLWSNGSDGVPNGPLYTRVLPDPNLRLAVETYLIVRHGERADPRALTSDMLQNALVREAIQSVEEQFALTCREAPALARKASLTA